MRIDANILRKRCKMQSPPGKQIAPGLWYIDRGSPILGVVHLDYVPRTTHFGCVRITPGGERIFFSGQLDDRIGLYTLLDVLPRMIHYPFDILLTTDEELCQSTARTFYTSKVYNWSFSFDRAGCTDVALYQYYGKETKSAVESAGLRAAHGSYSDIVELDSLGCAGFNWCNGSTDGHSDLAHVLESEYWSCIETFVGFFELYHSTRFVHLPGAYHARFYDLDEFDLYGDRCDLCGKSSGHLYDEDGLLLCPDCLELPDNGWVDECGLCGDITTVEYCPDYDTSLCQPCAEMLLGQEARTDGRRA